VREQLVLPLWNPTVPRTATATVAPAKTDEPPRLPRTKALQRALEQRLGRHIRVVITDTKSTLLSQSQRHGQHVVRIHQMFLDGSDDIFADLARFLASSDKGAGLRLDAFIDEQEHLLHQHVVELNPLAHVGRVHDLRIAMTTINRTYFDDAIVAEITWGQPGKTKRRRSITLGTYDDRAKRITIHPALDQAFVPTLCVERIVHHEMLHAFHPPEQTYGGRRVVHTAAFRRAEAGFQSASVADQWFLQHLDRLLRFRTKTREASPS
jgi:hypothetical protein